MYRKYIRAQVVSDFRGNYYLISIYNYNLYPYIYISIARLIKKLIKYHYMWHIVN